MSKIHKHKPKGIDKPKGLTTENLEKRAKADMSLQNYRRAKEWLKELCKRSNNQHLSQLIECYRGLAAQMLGKGQLAEANTVYEQIRQLGGNATDAIPTLVRKSPVASSAGLVHADGQPHITGVDAQVLAFMDGTTIGEGNPGVNDELAAVYRALKCVCAEQYPEALQELKRIGLKSTFANWRLFIKGMCAFYAGDDLRAQEAFRHLVDEPYLAKAVRPFLYIVEAESVSKTRNEDKEFLLRQVCAVLGRKDLEYVLPRAEYLWHVGRYSDSYEHVARMLTGFPSEELGLLRTLTRFYFNGVFQMDDRRMDNYLKRLRYVANKKKKNTLDNLLFSRVVNLLLETDDTIPPHEIVKLWEEFLGFHERLHGEHAKLRALVYAHLGHLFSQEEKVESFAPFFSGRNKQKTVIRHSRQAESAYRKSLDLNGSDKIVHLSLLYLYEKMGDPSKRNKKLDEISRLFPDDKETLVLNGRACIKRKAFLKGIECFKKAAWLDPLDRLIREDLGAAYIKAAISFAGKGATGRYRAFMEQAMGLDAADQKSYILGRPYLQLRLAVMEWIADCAEEGDRLLAEVLKKSGERALLCYFAYLIARIYGAPQQHWSKLEKRLLCEFENLSPAVIVTLTEMIEYVNRIDQPKFWIGKEFARVNRLAIETSDQNFTPAVAEKIIAYANRQGLSGKRLAGRYIHAGLTLDPRHPLFLYWQFMEKAMDSISLPKASDLKRLRDILVIAEERNDRAAINLLNKTVRNMEGMMKDLYDEDEPGMPDMEALNAFLENLKKEATSDRRQASSRNQRKTRANKRQTSLFEDTPF